MRLGVLDVGSNTVHLLVVDAHRGGHPTPMTSDKTELRLAEHLDSDGRITQSGADALVEVVRLAKMAATSETFRSLARLTGAAPSSAGLRTRRTLTDAGLRQWRSSAGCPRATSRSWRG